ncbi:MAG: plasmid recombination protein [Prevotella sp.]|nr:plasmid recombination protein [Prevotella sp.]
MAERKQVMDMRSNTDGISTPESNEQQRKWSDNLWDKKAQDGLANYDPSRAHLNFEVTIGGKVQPIDTSKSIQQKMEDILLARGIKNPNARKNVRRKQRILAQMIFGGSRDRMLEIAFGDQKLDFTKGADNSHLTRSEDIEKWAVDVYNFVAKRFGEQNIVSFYVHLDETNPHCHCTVIPVDEEKKRISWKHVFGQTPAEESSTFTTLHNELFKEVGSHWGMERGSNMAETGAKHRSTEEYKRDLVREVQSLENTKEGLEKQIHRMEIKLKSISTMIANLQVRKEKINEEIELIASQFGEEGQDNEQLASRMTELRKELLSIDHKLAQRQQMLNDTNNDIAKAKEKLEKVIIRHQQAQENYGDDIDREADYLKANMNITYNKMLMKTIEPLQPTLSDRQREILQDSGFVELTENSQDVINCALLLALRYVQAATEYAESHGGGGSGNLSGWGRDKDDDDERWWMKCIAQSAAMMKPSARKIKRGR